MEKHGSNSAIYVPKNGTYYKVALSDIQYVNADMGCIIIKTIKRKFALSSTLMKFAEQINNPNFLFIHRSYYVNIDHISNFQNDKVLIDKESIPMSRSGYKLLSKNIIRIKVK